MVQVLGLDVPSRRLSDAYHRLEMQAPLVPDPTNASQLVNPAVNARGYGGENMNLRGDGGVFEHYAEGAGFMTEYDDFTDSESDAISIFSGFSTASGGGESDHSDGAQSEHSDGAQSEHSDGAQSDLSSTRIRQSSPAEGRVLKQEDNATVSGSNSVGNASSGLPVAKEDWQVAI